MPSNKWRRHDGIRKITWQTSQLIVAGKNQWMPKLNVKAWWKMRYLNNLKVSVKKILINYKEETSPGKKPADTALYMWPKLTSLVTGQRYHVPLDLMHWEGHNVTLIVLPKMHNPNLILRKHQLNSNRCIIQNNLPVIFKNVNITRDKERFRNCSRFKEIEERYYCTNVNFLFLITLV